MSEVIISWTPLNKLELQKKQEYKLYFLHRNEYVFYVGLAMEGKVSDDIKSVIARYKINLTNLGVMLGRVESTTFPIVTSKILENVRYNIIGSCDPMLNLGEKIAPGRKKKIVVYHHGVEGLIPAEQA